MERLRLRRLASTIVFFAAALSAQGAEKALLRNGFAVRHERHEQLGVFTRLYLSAEPTSGYVDLPTDQILAFEEDVSAPGFPGTGPVPTSAAASSVTLAAAPFAPTDFDALVTKASDDHKVDPDLITSVIRAESSFNPDAVSPKGAQGLMQLMPGTAFELGVNDAFNPRDNIEAGTRYLRQLLLRYDNDIIKALAAYNAGPERVEKYRGVPPYNETRAYVSRIVRDFNKKKRTQRDKKTGAPEAGSHTSSRALD